MSLFGHMDIRVSDMAAAEPFYEALLPELGFTERYHGGEWKVWATVGAAYLGLVESRGHVANENRIAFAVDSAAEVDRLAAIAASAGAEVSGPKPMPYSEGYYAAFFEDPSGNRLEIYHRPG